MNKDKANKNVIEQFQKIKDGNVFMWLVSERACGTMERVFWNSDRHLADRPWI
jgi:hypothetical protein